MVKPLYIEKASSKQASTDFNFLRKSGIELIQKLSGKSWTDFNLHDPGLTILEQLCFGITELGYRTDFPIEGILSNEFGKIDYQKNAFFVKEEILTTNPVTINDFRKIIIDKIDEVKNAWLIPVKSDYSAQALNGLYKIIVQVDPKTAEKLLEDSNFSSIISDKVRKCFVEKRNLCEDVINEISVLKPEKLIIEADIMVESNRLAEEMLAYVFHHLENTLNPTVKYYTEDELLEKGMSIDQIYNGPFLTNGFIPDSELGSRKTLIDPTELVKSISDIDGVLSVKNLKIKNGQETSFNKPLKISDDCFPILDIKSSERYIKIFKDNIESNVKRPVFRSILNKIRESGKRDFISSFYGNSPLNKIEGKFRNNKVYHSIQNQFPNVYGIGFEGLPNNSSKSRKGQAKQLKGYLLFFEQIMANYLSQLSSIGEFLSIELNENVAETYYANSLYNVPDVKYLLRAFTSVYPKLTDQDWEKFKNDTENGYMTALKKSLESDDTFKQRKNQVLDHFLARFNEFVNSYPVKLFSTLYENNMEENKLSNELKWKSSILNNLSNLSSNRFRAYNYLDSNKTKNNWDFTSKMRLLLYISPESLEKKLSAVFNNDTITLESSRSTNTSANSKPVADFIQNDLTQILINKAEINTLFNEGRIIKNENIPNDAFLIQNQELSILKHALDIKNFRIAPDPGTVDSYIILFKSPQQDKWTIISRFLTHASAIKSLKNMIDYIKKVNIQSEGFYLVEHILLRPDLNSKVFGFKFVTKNGHNLMEHIQWMSFYEREAVMESLIKLSTDENELTDEKLAKYCKINLFHPVSELAESHSTNKNLDDQNIYSYFKIYADQKEQFLSRFQMVVKGENNTIINEDFFRLNMTVVFPSWPARFQDKGFRESAENLFRFNAPSHLKINFNWMGINKMKRFEAWYYDWKKFTADHRDPDTREVLRNALVYLLYHNK